MYNVSAVYEIIGRVLSGTYVVAYVVKDRRDSSTTIMQKQIVEQLALNKQIYNCYGQVYKKIVNLKGIHCKLSELPKYDMDGNPVKEELSAKKKSNADLQLIGKIQKGRSITSYVVIALQNPTKKIVLPRDKVLDLAKTGRIINAKSQMNGDTVVLRGDNGFNLAQLQTYTMK